MKFHSLPVAVLFAAISIAMVSAQEKPFSFKVEGDTLHIYSPDGKEVGTGLPTATIGKTVSAPPYSFQVSFGTDANGSLSVIVTPDPEHPAPLNFTLNNQEVHMDKGSVATLTLGADGATHVDGGLTGGVKVDSHPASTVSNTTGATGTPGAAPGASTASSASTAQNIMPSGTVAASPSNSPLGSLTPDAAPVSGLPSAGWVNSNPVAVLLVNAPTTVTNPGTHVDSSEKIIQVPGGKQVLVSADQPDIGVPLNQFVSPQTAFVNPSTGNAVAPQNISSSLANSITSGATISSVTGAPTIIGVGGTSITISTSPPSTTPF